MVIVHLSAGLGNQFYQYAYAKCLAMQRNQRLLINTSHYYSNGFRQYGLQHFNINAWQFNVTAFKKYIFIKPLVHYFKANTTQLNNTPLWVMPNQNTLLNKHIALTGTWSFPQMFVHIRQHLLQAFTLKNKPQANVAKLISKVATHQSVSIHIRQGDYKTSIEAAEIFILLNKKYYDDAVALMQNKIANPQFYIFTDDVALAKEWYFQDNFTIVSNNNFKDYEELEIMKNCQHNIIANSTFSWWAAWLNNNPNKIVIQPKVWYKNAELQMHYNNNTIIGQIGFKINNE